MLQSYLVAFQFYFYPLFLKYVKIPSVTKQWVAFFTQPSESGCHFQQVQPKIQAHNHHFLFKVPSLQDSLQSDTSLCFSNFTSQDSPHEPLVSFAPSWVRHTKLLINACWFADLGVINKNVPFPTLKEGFQSIVGHLHSEPTWVALQPRMHVVYTGLWCASVSPRFRITGMRHITYRDDKRQFCCQCEADSPRQPSPLAGEPPL